MDRSKIVTELVSKGLSMREIAKKIDLSATAVQYWVKKLGLKARYSYDKKGHKPPKYINSIGKTYGHLKIISLKRIPKNGLYVANCFCLLCKRKKIINIQNILRGSSKSCGCSTEHYFKVTGKNNTQFTGHEEISGRYWNTIKRRASKRNLKFNLTIDFAWKLFIKQNRRCALSGIILKFGRSEYTNETTASLDRINNKKGYEIGNIQWVHKDINVMKNIHSEEYFKILCAKITSYKKIKGDFKDDSEIFNRGRYRTN